MSHRSPQRITIAGASLAGLRAAERLRREGFDGALTIVGAEAHLPYDRPPLSKALLRGEVEPADIALKARVDVAAEWLLGDPAVALDLGSRRIRTRLGREVDFDGLVIATGSVPRRLAELDPRWEGIHELRTLDDALALKRALEGSPKVLIVGSGFIGVELASTARARGLETGMVALDEPLAAAGPLASAVCRGLLGEHRVDVVVGRTVARCLGSPEGVEGVILDDGRRLHADLIVVAVGALPATGWLAGSGLELDAGVECDECCSAADGVVAAGDVASWRSPLLGGERLRVEHWSNAVEQAAAAARTLLRGPGTATAYRGLPSFWSDHFGHRLESLGLPGRAERFQVVAGDPRERRFAAEAWLGECLVGVIAYDMPGALGPYRHRLQERVAEAVA